VEGQGICRVDVRPSPDPVFGDEKGGKPSRPVGGPSRFTVTQSPKKYFPIHQPLAILSPAPLPVLVLTWD
jgi:hypothetical protein